MANVNKVNGFKPFRYLNGAPYNGAFNKYVVPASDGTALFVGDLVTSSATADATTGLPGCVVSGTTGAALGAIVGFEVDPTNLNTPQYRVASTRRIVYVADDPALVFVAQEDGVSNPIDMVDAGKNITFVAGAGSTVTGSSGHVLDSDSTSDTSTVTLKLIGAVQSPDNELTANGQAYTRWMVKINNHVLGGLGSAGI